MNILILHNAYQHRGGEDSVVELEGQLLREAGHAVHIELVSNEAIFGFPSKVKTILRTPYNRHRKQWMSKLLRRTKAEVVHIHNFFPLLTPAVHEAASEQGIAVVQTMHNFRTICASALLLRNGEVCEKCVSGNRFWGVAHRCYRNSFVGSLAVVQMQRRAFQTSVWEKHVHRIIALTSFARKKLIEGGLPENRLVVKPNFVEESRGPGRKINRRGVLFVGRLSEEKGVDQLIDAWKSLQNIPLKIIGDGPRRNQLETNAPSNVSFMGLLSREEVLDEMAKASALIMPSIWYEGFPMTIVEAFSAGLPVIASRLGSMAEIITHGENGLHFNHSDSSDLAEVVRAAFAQNGYLGELGRRAFDTYRANYTPKRNLEILEGIYLSAIEENRVYTALESNKELLRH